MPSRRAELRRSSGNIDWQHERAIAEWDAERTHDPAKGLSLNRWKYRKRQWAGINALRETYLTGTRRRAKHAAEVKIVPLGVGGDYFGEDPRGDRDDREALVRACLEALKPRYREVLLRALAGRTIAEIADELGISKAWTTAVRAKAMEQIRRELMRRGALKRRRPYTTREML